MMEISWNFRPSEFSSPEFSTLTNFTIKSFSFFPPLIHLLFSTNSTPKAATPALSILVSVYFNFRGRNFHGQDTYLQTNNLICPIQLIISSFRPSLPPPHNTTGVRLDPLLEVLQKVKSFYPKSNYFVMTIKYNMRPT